MNFYLEISDHFSTPLKIFSIKHEILFFLSFFQPLDRTSVKNTRRLFNSMNVYLEFENDEDVNFLKEVLKTHGQNVKTLEWTNWSKFVLKHDDVIEIFGLLPNLEELQLSSWSVEFLKPDGSAENVLNLRNLKKLEFSHCDDFIVDFMVNFLPKNIIQQLKIDEYTKSGDSVRNLIGNQQSIVNLDIEGYGFSKAVFSSLKLTHLRCVSRDSETPLEQQTFLKALIASQPGLKFLDTLSDRDFSYNFVNDEIFQEITKCHFLESLKINIDGVSATAIRDIKKLEKLNYLELKTNVETSLEVFEEFSLQKLPLEHLYLHLWGFEIPQQTYKQFGENFNLKSLKIKLGTWHQINFFIESFPSLESLSIRFGEANNTVELSRVFSGEDLKIHEKIKSLNLTFWGGELITCEKLLKLLSSFPNLEKLKITSKFPFSSEFFNILSTSLRHIKSLEILGIAVDDEEKFSSEVIESLKTVARKLEYCNFIIQYKKDLFFGENVQNAYKFTFEPLMVLKDVFKINEATRSNIRLMKHLTLISGKEIKQ